MRAFVAVPLEAAARREIAALVAPFAGRDSAARWVREENLHLTLAFLGEIEPTLVSLIAERLAPVAAATAARELVLGRLGGFPPARPRVLWLGLEDGRDWFIALARAVRAPLERGLGLALDQREPAAHVTLARLRRDDPELVPRLAAAVGARTVRSRADAMTLFSSRLGPVGPTYQAVESWSFAA